MAAERGIAARWALLALLACAGAPRAAAQGQVPDGFSDQLVVGGLSQPAGLAFMPDGRLLIAEQSSAQIRLLTLVPNAPLVAVGTVPGVNTNGGERGLLGIAVDPRWPGSPYLYVHSTATGPPTHIAISRFTASGDLAGAAGGDITIDPGSRYDLLANIPDIASNHNGGTVRFGLDGGLYVSLGEDATPCAAQDTVSLRGVILRLDVTRLPAGAGSAPRALVAAAGNPFATSPDSNARLVWAYGLRNPFRFQVDRVTGELWVGDVGQDTWEELDRVPAGGLDFGWPVREGPIAYPGSCPALVPPALTEPAFSYSHASIGGGSAAIISAGRYHAPSGALRPFPSEYDGSVFVSDFYAGQLWRLTGSGDSYSIGPPVPGQPPGDQWGRGFGVVSDYAIGPDGSLYYCRQAAALNFVAGTGEIRRVSAAAGPPVSVGVMSPIAALRPAFPQPSRDAVRLDFALSRAARVEVAIHDLRGRLVRRLVPRQQRAAGSYSESWDGFDGEGRAVDSGLYFGHFTAGNESQLWRIIIAR